jgi:hypothetical protein
MMNPVACITGVLPSAPLVTVHVVPETFVTAIDSVGAAGSATWKPLPADVDAVGNDADDVTCHVSDVPEAGAVDPVLPTAVVCA